jgi:hypothetical protein
LSATHTYFKVLSLIYPWSDSAMFLALCVDHANSICTENLSFDLVLALMMSLWVGNEGLLLNCC